MTTNTTTTQTIPTVEKRAKMMWKAFGGDVRTGDKDVDREIRAIERRYSRAASNGEVDNGFEV